MRMIILFLILITSLVANCFAQYSSLGDSASSPFGGDDSTGGEGPSAVRADSVGSGYSSTGVGDSAGNSGYYATGPGDSDGIGYSSSAGRPYEGYEYSPENGSTQFSSPDVPDENSDSNADDGDNVAVDTSMSNNDQE